MASSVTRWLAPRAWIDGAWRERVLLECGDDGCWSRVTADIAEAPPDAVSLEGPVLPGIVNAHSHAFQRAFAGLAEDHGGGDDDFWSWRDRMYTVANRVTPGELRDIATRLYASMLRGGYTHVCEFHYVHHAPDGARYANPLAMSEALVDAAQATGIGLTLLPVLYERAGFSQPALRPDQRRFATTVDDVIALRDGVRKLRARNVDAGVAIHSLRAATPEAIFSLAARVADDPGPVHIHVAEQRREVDESVRLHGRRPLEWLLANVAVDARWQLVHATHATRAEIDGVARQRAGVVLCPTTEANLGDGVTDVPGWLAARVPLSIGSDSQVTLDWREELRLLEYGQRLVHERRNVAADAARSSATRLLALAVAAGGAAAGFQRWGLVPGARADFVVVDDTDLPAGEASRERLLDALVFVSPATPFRDVAVAGRWVVRNGRTARAA